jgi:hypothetical protein
MMPARHRPPGLAVDMKGTRSICQASPGSAGSALRNRRWRPAGYIQGDGHVVAGIDDVRAAHLGVGKGDDGLATG